MDGPETVFRARRIYRDRGDLLLDGAVVCRDGRIVSVGPWEEQPDAGARVVDLGDVLLLPGLVNAHCHLRLTHLKGKIRPTKHFVRWLGRIALANKLTRKSTLRKSIRAGVDELIRGGVTTAVDIDLEGLSAETAGETPLRLVFAHECINLDPTKAAGTAQKALRQAAKFPSQPLRREHGLAPHAPYSVCGELWEALAERLRSERRFLTIHVAESCEEVEMLGEGGGALYRTLRCFGVIPRGWTPPGRTPVEFLERSGILESPGVAAHCGAVDDRDTQILARRGWTVAFCPGTHEYFQRPPWPFERFRRAGTPVCVATDSAASNTGLNMMTEMRRFASMFRDLTAGEIVAAATSIPAKAIGWGEAVGRIEPGYCADFSAWAPAAEGAALDRRWFEGAEPRCTATVIGGTVVYP